MKKAKGVYRTLPAKNPEARATRILQLTVDGAGAELHTSACYHCRRNLLPLLQKSALECPRIPRAWVWASVALEPSSEDYLKDNFSSQPNVSTEILYPFFVVVMSVIGDADVWWFVMDDFLIPTLKENRQIKSVSCVVFSFCPPASPTSSTGAAVNQSPPRHCSFSMTSPLDILFWASVCAPQGLRCAPSWKSWLPAVSTFI